MKNLNLNHKIIEEYKKNHYKINLLEIHFSLLKSLKTCKLA